MNDLVRFCHAAHKPAMAFAYLLIVLNFVATGSLKLFLHRWHWVVVALISLVLFITIIVRISRKRFSEETAHV